VSAVTSAMVMAGARAMVLLARKGETLPSRTEEARACLEAALASDATSDFVAPIVWRYSRKDWNGAVWRYVTAPPEFETPDDWIVQIYRPAHIHDVLQPKET
jgi:hypothetical protein